MKITSARVRILEGNGIYAIGSVTIDYLLTINDIKIERKDKKLSIKLPNTEHAKQNNQFSIMPQEALYKKIRNALFKEIKKAKKAEKSQKDSIVL